MCIFLCMKAPILWAEKSDIKIPEQEWSFQKATGTFDRRSLQRGLQVYKQVCAACHGLKFVAFRTLSDLGYNEDEIKAFASSFIIADGPDQDGKMFERPGLPRDAFPNPYPNVNAAKASNGGAEPPDLSLITKAKVNGLNYMYALLTGYTKAPKGFEISSNLYYNQYFPGHKIAMPQPLSKGLVTYTDGTDATIEQMAHDVVTFLAWAAEPELEQRKTIGVKFLIYTFIMSLLFYLSMRRIWKNVN
ncbi:MAG: cytochrome c1 [Candidatus Puniceispirillum sp.]|nr:cytochrome c1 [Candidatus Pelagibacter sp.]MBA4283136.1 cytochrome c1 [Candidatus Puniceispirillum sp.]